MVGWAGYVARMKKFKNILFENLKRKYNLGGFGVVDRIILQCASDNV
jgi:hypothetical protein